MARPTLLHRRRTTAALAAAVLTLATAGILVVTYTDPPGSGWLSHLGCSERPLRENRPDSYRYPYGQVRSCRLLDRQARWFGEVDATTYLLLDTERGAVALRVEYRDHDIGRRMTAIAVELPAQDMPVSLSAADQTALDEAMQARGGVNPEPWTLRYGDG